MIDVVTGGIEAVEDEDWYQTWLESREHQDMMVELDRMIGDAAAKPPGTYDDGLRIISALSNGFSFWRIGPSVSAPNLKMFSIFSFVFLAPGVINQLQPSSSSAVYIYNAREKKSKMYSWVAFVIGLIVPEFPYRVVCTVLYFLCWYYCVRLSHDSSRAGATFRTMLCALVLFCGIFVPYTQLNVFWKYYNPFNYVVSTMLTFNPWAAEVTCNEDDQMNGTYATSQCKVFEYRSGSDFLTTLNINQYYYGWRDAAITVTPLVDML
ncbi:hypothetical protein CNMCM5793_005822 [Aspergillus hiratsukae]|uniref:ABC-2 type transporter transmembrane domain-containing protein n=1 Tax=Aspergillus hiratsukae TaxID=1194566 RepID=A0A8H6QFY9_9EURO|nr:hypothetical protein CNMCM5793_005822 [Aspergillus hiratsukae]KAF7172253.1 hypothetical protein CNMCM6106_006489 [Aspergillus hiratsukae]